MSFQSPANRRAAMLLEDLTNRSLMVKMEALALTTKHTRLEEFFPLKISQNS